MSFLRLLLVCMLVVSMLLISNILPQRKQIFVFFPDDWGGSGCSNGSRQIASGNTQSPGSPDSKYTSQLLSVFEECALLTICVITLLNGWMSWCNKSLQKSLLWSGLGLWIVNGHHQEKGFRGWKTFCVLNIFHASAVSIVEVFNWLTVAKPPNVTPVSVSGCSGTSKQRLTGCGEQMLIQRLFARNSTVTNKKQSCERHCVMGDIGENMAEKEQLYMWNQISLQTINATSSDEDSAM